METSINYKQQSRKSVKSLCSEKIKLSGKVTLVEQNETANKDGNTKGGNFNDRVKF